MASPRADLVAELAKMARKTGMVCRRWCVINAVHAGGSPPTVDVKVGGSSTVVTGVRYNGSVTAPVATETWALDLVDGTLVAVYKLA